MEKFYVYVFFEGLKNPVMYICNNYVVNEKTYELYYGKEDNNDFNGENFIAVVPLDKTIISKENIKYGV